MKKLSVAFLIVGGLLLLVGLYFERIQWLDNFLGMISGPILMFIGLVFYLIYRFKKKALHLINKIL